MGPQPAWFHALNLALHVAVTLLVAGLVMRLLRPANEARPAGFAAAALFAVHPIHTEVIAWASCAPELLCALFSLLTLYFYASLRTAGGHDESRPGPDRSRPAKLAAMAISQLLAALSKEVGLVVPVIIVGYELLRRRMAANEAAKKRPARISITTLASLAAPLLVYAAARLYAMGAMLPAGRQTQLSWQEHVWTAVALFYRYLAAIVFPLRLNFFRYYPLTRSALEPEALAGWLSLACFGTIALWLWRQRSLLALATLLYLLPLLPVFQLPYADTGLLILERSAYLPSVGFCWLAASGLWALAGRGFSRAASRVPPHGSAEASPYRLRWPAAALTLVLLAAYTVRSAWRVADWSNEAVLFTQGIELAPASFHLRAVYGSSLLRAGQPAAAARELAECVRLNPGYADGHNLLARAYWALGEGDRALGEYQTAAQLATLQGRGVTASRAWNSMAVVYQLSGRGEEAVAAYRRSLAFDPDFVAARTNLGLALLGLGEVAAAIEELRVAVQGDPSLAKAHSNLGLAWTAGGQYDKALAELQAAEHLSPGDAEVQARMGELHLRRGENDAARARFTNALRMQPGNRRALAGLDALGVK